MKKLLGLLVGLVLTALANPAYAQATRTWVSGTGNDANPCSRTAPCQTFAGAFSKTATNGEIDVLDPHGFGAVTISKSITIDGKGPMASILASGVNGITVNGAGAIVNIRNLTINGVNSTTGNGIRILNAAAVNIENVVIENFGGTGSNGRCIDIATSAANVRVTINNVQLVNCNNDGIQSAPTAGNVILTIDDSSIARGGDSAIALVSNTVATISNTTATNHAVGAGLSVEQTSVTAHVSNSVFANNAFGVFSGVGGSPTTRLFGTVITGNTSAGLQITAGSVFTHGNNAIRGNTGNETPTGASLGTQ